MWVCATDDKGTVGPSIVGGGTGGPGIHGGIDTKLTTYVSLFFDAKANEERRRVEAVMPSGRELTTFYVRLDESPADTDNGTGWTVTLVKTAGGVDVPAVNVVSCSITGTTQQCKEPDGDTATFVEDDLLAVKVVPMSPNSPKKARNMRWTGEYSKP